MAVSHSHLDDRNMSMRILELREERISCLFFLNLFSPPALFHAEAATHAFYRQFLDIHSSAVFS